MLLFLFQKRKDGNPTEDKNEVSIKGVVTAELLTEFLSDKGSVSLANGAADHSRTVYAYKCGECKKVIIDYSAD